MIRVDIKPRQDDRYDIYVSDDNGNALLNSNQGYDAHEPTITAHGVHVCRCGFRAPEAHWLSHLADALAVALTPDDDEGALEPTLFEEAL